MATSFPTRPRFARQCVVIPFDGGVAIDGMADPIILRGPAALEVLPRLVPLMDGSRTFEQITQMLEEIPRERLLSVACLLVEHGLIDGVDPSPATTRNNPNTVAFLRRQTSYCPKIDFSREVETRLANVMVVICSPNKPYGALMGSMLSDSGVRNFHVLSPAEAAQQIKAAPNDCQTILLPLLSDDMGSESDTLGDICFRAGASWLRTTVDLTNGYADLGPLFTPGKTACYQCFVAVHGQQSSFPRHEIQKLDDSLAALWTGIVATELLYKLSGRKTHLIVSGFRRYSLRDWTHKDLVTPQLPGCSSCHALESAPASGAAETESACLDTSIVFEEYMAHRFSFISSGAYQDEEVSQPWWPTKYIPASRRWSMEDYFEWDSAAKQIPTNCDKATSVTFEELVYLLKLTAGVQVRQPPGPINKRWCATAGNLSSVELYVSINRNRVLPAGLFYYQSADDSLARITSRQRQFNIFDLIDPCFSRGNLGSIDALIIFTAAYHRVKRKYGPFAYRLVHLDAGVAMSQFKLIASEMKIFCLDVPLRSDDLIVPLLCLHHPDEQTMPALAITKDREAATSLAELIKRLAPAQPRDKNAPSVKNASAYAGLDLAQITEMMIGESRGNRVITPENEPLRAGVCNAFIQGSIRLPRPSTAGRNMSLFDLLRSRRSVRSYAGTVSLETFTNCLFCIREYRNAAATSRGIDPDIFIFSSDVEGVRRGLFWYDLGDHKLIRIAAVEESVDLRSIYVQPELALAPLHFFLVVNQMEICRRAGVYGYKRLLLTLGETVHRVSMAALASGLVGTIVAGVHASRACELFKWNRYSTSCLVAYCAGKEIAHTK